MQIQWLGQSHFKIQTKNNGQEIIIATDPYSENMGLKVSKYQADIVTVSHDHDDHNNTGSIKGEPFVISEPGEYETKGVFVCGIPAFHDDNQGKERGNIIIYKIHSEEMNLVHLGDLGCDLNDEQLEKIGDVDILFIPVGEVYTIDTKKAKEIVSIIEPRIVIPMHYQIPGLKLKSKLSNADEFLKISGLPAEKIDKLKISKKDLPQDETKIIQLNP